MNARIALTVVGLSAGAVLAGSDDGPIPLFGDWYYLMPEGWRDVDLGRGDDPCSNVPLFDYDGSPTYIPVSHPSGNHGGPSYVPGSWMAWYADCLANQFDQLDAPIAIMIRNRNCPFPYYTGGEPTDPNALANALDALPKLDYVFMDLEDWEGTGEDILRANVEEVVRLVRSHPNPRVSNAYIGNYSDMPIAYDPAQIWHFRRDRTRFTHRGSERWDRQALYLDNFNVAMPNAYHYQVYSRHSDAQAQQGQQNTTPNDHDAIFWAPLERVSACARELPQGHVLIPWLCNYVSTSSQLEHYHAPPPTWSDMEAFAQHLRMRGCTSFMLWTADDGQTFHPFVDYEEYRDLCMSAWRMLDPLFDNAGRIEFLNLETEKTSPVHWSGVRAADEVWILVSNLDETESHSVELPLIGGLPARTPPVGPGEHVIFSYQCSPGIRDFDFSGNVNSDDFVTFVLSLRNANPSWPNSVGGKGADPRDTNGDNLVDLRDVMEIAFAYFRGEYTEFQRSREQVPSDGL